MSPRFRLIIRIEQWPLKTPFRITGHTWQSFEAVVAGLEADGHCGFGEAAGVYYRGETSSYLKHQLESVRGEIESTDLTSEAIQELLPPGGARNALDCALWDWKAKVAKRTVWQLANLPEPRPLITTFTCGAGSPASMAATARGYEGAKERGLSSLS